LRPLQVWDNLRKILLFNLPVNFAQGTSIFWAYVIGFHESPLTAIQVRLLLRLIYKELLVAALLHVCGLHCSLV
jgi:magnesium-transporting ATPase (P-type)